MNALAPLSTLCRRLPPLTNQSEFAQKESTHDLNDAIIFSWKSANAINELRNNQNKWNE